MNTEPTALQRQAQRNGNGPRVPGSRQQLIAERRAIAATFDDILINGTATTSIGRHRGDALSDPNERSAARAQYGRVAAHRAEVAA